MLSNVTPNTAESKYFKTLFQIFNIFIRFETFKLLYLSRFRDEYKIKLGNSPSCEVYAIVIVMCIAPDRDISQNHYFRNGNHRQSADVFIYKICNEIFTYRNQSRNNNDFQVY